MKPLWLVPFNPGNHWTLFVVNRIEKKILYIDSFRPGPPVPYIHGKQQKRYRLDIRHIQDLQDLIEVIGKDGSWLEWDVIVPDNIEKQVGGSDCGVHVCLYAECLILGCIPDLSPRRMTHHRQRIRHSISVSAKMNCINFQLSRTYFY